MTKLSTTIGIELTFVSPLMQTIVDAQNPERDQHPDQFLSEYCQSDICRAYVAPLERLLASNNVKVLRVATDPGCVEIPTLPYKTTTGLAKAIRGVWRCARKLELMPTLPSFYGGGCHIHAGVVGATKNERDAFARRMAVFVSQNPWLVEAFIGLSDGNSENATNAATLSQRHLLQMNDGCTIEGLIARYENVQSDIISITNCLHTRNMWTGNDTWLRSAQQRELVRLAVNRMNLRKRIARLRRADVGMAQLKDIWVPEGKGNAVRHAPYGKYGTMEFRMFEMPEDIATILKYVHVVDSIVKHVAAQTYTEVRKDTLPTSEQIKAMPWSQRRAGFLSMLGTLGLDPADFKAERVQIALRMRAQRPAPVKVVQLTDEDNYAMAA